MRIVGSLLVLGFSMPALATSALAQASADPASSPATASESRGATGSWAGTLVRSGQTLSVRVTFSQPAALGSNVAGNLVGSFSADSQAVQDYPFVTVSMRGQTIAFVLGGGDLRFSGELRDDRIQGTFDGDEGKGTFALQRTATPRLPYTTREVTFANRGVTLHGTMCLPTTPGTHAAVVLLQGSGPESRWGTNRFIADRLARSGIAAIAFDKRGSGDSTGSWRSVGYEALADDAIAAMRVLAKEPSVDPHRIGLWGHSQGGFIAPLIAHRSGHVAFIVAADSNASTNQEQDILRVTNEIHDHGWTGRDGASALAVYEQFLHVAASGGAGYDALAAQLKREKAHPWADWIGVPPRTSWLFTWYPLVANYDSRTYWKTVRVPVLLVYGQHDELSDVPGSIAKIRALVSRAGGPPVMSIVIAGAPHTLHIAPMPGHAFFWWHMAPEYPGDEIAWVRRATRTR